MLSRRDFVQIAAAAAVLSGGRDALAARATAQSILQDDLLAFLPVGQVTLLNYTDCHAQLRPLYFREPSVNIGVGADRGRAPHITGKDFLKSFGLKAGTSQAYAFTAEDFTQLARNYGRIGGMDRMATLIKAIRAERPNNTLLIDCGDSWQGSYTALQTRGEDMVRVQNALGVDAFTGHWEFTYGADRVKELAGMLNAPFLCGNVKDATWNDDVFAHTAFFERGGVKIAVIGQAFPYTPVANPRHLIPDWSFGIREEELQKHVDAARAQKAELVVLASHNGFDVDRKLAERVTGIDVILTGHTHDAVPAVLSVGRTLLVASGSHGKFLARLDLDIRNGQIADFRFSLIPVFADAITPDPEMAALIADIRKPYESHLRQVLGRTESLLYRRGNFNGSFDDLICQALLRENDAEIALSPGFRWGRTLLPGEDITWEHVYDQTAVTYPAAYRTPMTGERLKEILEDIADNLFHPDPYYQQGGDMVRAGGLAYQIDIKKPVGERISNLRLGTNGPKLEASKEYIVSGWASVQEDVKGPPVWELVARHIKNQKTIRIPQNTSVKVVGA